MILGTGVGGGIAIDGRVLEGKNAIAGEWGHTPLPWPTDEEHPGLNCYCGKKGCIETWLSGPSLATQITNAEDEGAAIRHYEDRLARALSVIVNILDPDVIVLGGGVSNRENLYSQHVLDKVAEYAFSDTLTTKIVANKHGDSSGVRGAAWLWPAE